MDEYQIQNTASSNDIFDLNGYNQGLGANVYKTEFKSIGSDNNSQGIISHAPFSKSDDLKSMLESNKDGLKLEAMKKLITMVAKGRTSSDVSAKDLFPHVVKNVVTKNAELKKLVYLYLLRYAEQEPDLILLSISTFQRSLKDPNPLMRASALRVMSSIRVKIIAPIMYISIKDCSTDMSPYVRKTAAHAIPKLYNLEPEMKEDIISIIEKLLQDRTSLVLGSAVAAFEEVCPERFDLIHPNYRKFVSLMADFDEWGQVILINMLIRYGRSQFLNPNVPVNANNHDADDDDEEMEFNFLDNLDPDHRLLLKNAKPLLQSRNSAVVMAVIQLYLYLAPHSELNSVIVRPLIRLLHSKPEIQIVILTNIASLTSTHEDDHLIDEENDEEEKNVEEKGEDDQEDPDYQFLMQTNQKSNQLPLKNLFEPLLKSFFVKSKDPTQVRILKLKILTNLSSSYNIPLILREYQAYINNYQDDMQFVSATIEAIGKCASRIKEIASICLNGLISLLSNRNEAIIAQSIIVIRKQIINKQRQIERKLMNGTVGKQNGLEKLNDNESNNERISPSKNKKKDYQDEKSDHIISLVIKQVSKLIVDKIKTPAAKATVLWILAEFCDKNMKAYQLSPDILRLVAKSFINEVEIVKLQAINLAAKVYLTTCYFETCKNYFNHDDKERIKLLINYIFNLAKYDLNYDVRDRARFLRQLLNKSNTNTGLQLAQKVLMAPKNIFIENKNRDDQVDNSNDQYAEIVNEPIDDLVNKDETKSAPSLVNGINEISKFRIGTLSHFLGKTVSNYEELPAFPLVKPDPSVRNTRVEEEDIPVKSNELDLNSPIRKKLNRSESNQNFYSNESSGSDESESESESSGSTSGLSSEEIESEEASDSDNEKNKSDSSSESESGTSDSEDDSESDSDVSTKENGVNSQLPNLSKDKLIKC